MRGHLIATAVWVALIAGGYLAFEHFNRSDSQVLGCEHGSGAVELVLAAARDGHFYVDGTVNGAPVRFLVDTGASLVTVGTADASRARLSDGRPAVFDTAAGRVAGSIVRGQTVQAECLPVGDLSIAVNPGLAGVALLGQNFLKRFEVVQTAGELRLRVRARAVQ